MDRERDERGKGRGVERETGREKGRGEE